MLIIQGLALLGILTGFLRLIAGVLDHLFSFVSRPVTNVYVSRNEFNMESHTDPTRPNFTEDESAAWLRVTDMMRTIDGKKKP
jgi:hypothetical protein